MRKTMLLLISLRKVVLVEIIMSVVGIELEVSGKEGQVLYVWSRCTVSIFGCVTLCSTFFDGHEFEFGVSH